ncbi:MAG TPA: c-type cytochrome [Chloroflexi bacterium]|nr:c-type cytochrome [Chloroflexota bacterium]
MNKYLLTTIIALAVLVIAVPVYGFLEAPRMESAQAELRQQFVSDAAVMYIENCAVCHGAQGEGIGAIPPLNTEGLRQTDYDFLYKTIARGRYGTAMTGWHADEGGIYNDYQIDELVSLIRYASWPTVGELSAQRGLIPPTLPVPDVDEAFLEQVTALGAEGAAWAEGIQLYANNCTICHGVTGEGSELGVPLNTPELRATDADELARIIHEGAPGTMMSSWDQVLDDDEIAALVSFLQNWDKIEAAGLALTPPAPIQIDLNNPAEVYELGGRIFDTTCVACHGENGSGGSGPAINSQQFLTHKSDEQIRDAVIYGGHRPNSIMPAFGDRLTSVEIDALVQYIRAWEPTAPWVENPRGTEQGGGGPPWMRATPDANNPVQPHGQGGGRRGKGKGGGGGGPWWRQEGETPPGQSGGPAGEAPMEMGPALVFRGEVISAQDNLLTFRSDDGQTREAMLGPPWFWSESGIPLSPGNRIELEAFESPDHMEINWLNNLSTAQSIQLRAPEGMPVWTQ